MGASAKPILFGDLEQSYMLRTDGQTSILRLNERYADTLEVGFYLWSRIGGLYLGQTSVYPIVALQQASS
jgi:HK97 family phage major capsid protein